MLFLSNCGKLFYGATFLVWCVCGCVFWVWYWCSRGFDMAGLCVHVGFFVCLLHVGCWCLVGAVLLVVSYWWWLFVGVVGRVVILVFFGKRLRVLVGGLLSEFSCWCLDVMARFLDGLGRDLISCLMGRAPFLRAFLLVSCSRVGAHVGGLSWVFVRSRPCSTIVCGGFLPVSPLLWCVRLLWCFVAVAVFRPFGAFGSRVCAQVSGSASSFSVYAPLLSLPFFVFPSCASGFMGDLCLRSL